MVNAAGERGSTGIHPGLVKQGNEVVQWNGKATCKA